jgi:predicted ATP-grasp superfamily ATP-dependent carboligase
MVADKLNDPWLVAAWPGMGLVGHLAVSHLVRALGTEPLREISAADHFDAAKVEVKSGILLPIGVPRTLLTIHRGEGGKRDLVFLQSERQPDTGIRRFCGTVTDVARELGVARMFTFAAMATPMPPDAVSRVFTVATDAAFASELRALGLSILEEGEIGGMNGVLLAAAAERRIPGACLLGEFPFFASGIPNPKASAAILRAFARISGIEVDLSELDAQAAQVEEQLKAHLASLEEAARARARGRRSGEREGDEEAQHEDWPKPRSDDDDLSPEDKARIESLFEAAHDDHSRAVELKAELDRLGQFRHYENRFLDLFKKGE